MPEKARCRSWRSKARCRGELRLCTEFPSLSRNPLASYAGTSSAGGLRRVRSVGSTGSFCMVKSRSHPGRLYSYGPRYATGVIRKFPCGGGDGAVHSNVVASHGLSFTFSPCLMLQKKLMMNGICARPMIHAAHEMG